MLRRMSKRTEILGEIKRRKLEYFGHVMRNSKYKLLQLIIQGKVEGRRGPSKNFMLEELTSVVWALYSERQLIKYKSCCWSPTFLEDRALEGEEEEEEDTRKRKDCDSLVNRIVSE